MAVSQKPSGINTGIASIPLITIIILVYLPALIVNPEKLYKMAQIDDLKLLFYGLHIEWLIYLWTENFNVSPKLAHN